MEKHTTVFCAVAGVLLLGVTLGRAQTKDPVRGSPVLVLDIRADRTVEISGFRADPCSGDREIPARRDGPAALALPERRIASGKVLGSGKAADPLPGVCSPPGGISPGRTQERAQAERTSVSSNTMILSGSVPNPPKTLREMPPVALKDGDAPVQPHSGLGTPNLAVYTGSGAVNTYTYFFSHRLDITSSIGNDGTDWAYGFRVGWYLSTNTTITTSDYLIATASIGSLNYGWYVNQGVSVILDFVSGLPSGTYYIGVILDDENAVSELNESDNSGYFTQTIYYTGPEPNLTLYGGSGSVNTHNYNTTTHQLDVMNSVWNAGGVAAGEFRTGWYLSPDTIISPSDFLIATVTTSNLDAGYYLNLDASVNLDSLPGLATGTYYLGVYYDDLYQVGESEGGDNWAFFTTSLYYPGIPNLTLYQGSGSVNGYYYNRATEYLTIICSVVNVGAVPAGAFRVGFYLVDTSGNNSYLLMTIPVVGLTNGYYKVLGDSVVPGTIGGLTPGRYWVIISIDDQLAVGESDENDNIWRIKPSFMYTVYPSSVQLSNTQTFGPVDDITNYKMMSIPGRVDIPLADVLGGSQPYDWNAYWDNGGASDYQVQYDGSAIFHFVPGRAFWILGKNSFSVSQTVNTVPLEPDQTFSIPLHNGWNIISNPFDGPLPWSDVETLNPGIQPIHYFDKSYSQPAAFEPYKGYYFDNIGNLPSIRIPFSVGGISPRTRVACDILFRNPAVRLTLRDASGALSSVSVRFDPAARRGFDVSDIFSPPGDFEKAGITICNPAIECAYKNLMVDSRPAAAGGDVFDVRVKNITGGQLTLSATIGNGVEGSEVYLIDDRLGNAVNLRENSAVPLSGHYGRSTYRLVVGSREAVNDLLHGLTPAAYKLYQNSPNPFNPSTMIRFAVPTESRVKVGVINLLGEQVATVAEGLFRSGVYEFGWSARNLASGCYFYTITAVPLDNGAPFVETKKMILAK